MSGLARWREEDGSAGGLALVVLVGLVGLMLVLGLVVDGGAKLAAADRANRIAMEAARAGAQMIDGQAQGTVDQAVQQYLAAEGVTGSATVTGNRVQVTVQIDQPTKVLSLIGLDRIHVTGSGFADVVYTPAGGP